MVVFRAGSTECVFQDEFMRRLWIEKLTAYFTPCRPGISHDGRPGFHPMPGHRFTASRAGISRMPGRGFIAGLKGEEFARQPQLPWSISHGGRRPVVAE